MTIGNAGVAVSYRKKGEASWRKALPLLRLQRESVIGGLPRDGSGEHFNRYVAPNMLAGSILNLEPDTAYEARFVLSDPDGVKGKKEQLVAVRTRKEPTPAQGGAVYHVYPFDYKGPKEQPAFTGLLAAYYLGSDQSDHSREMPPRVYPGDTILIHAGVYKDNRFVYSGFDKTIAAYGTPFDGTYYLTQNGTPDRPIVIKGAGDGEAIFDGDGCDNLFNLMGGNYNYFEGITVRNTQVAFKLGIKSIAGSSGFTLKHSRVYDIGRVVEAGWSGSKDFYIADNVFIGRHDPKKLQSWFTPEVWGKFRAFPHSSLRNTRSRSTDRATWSSTTMSRTGTTGSTSTLTATRMVRPTNCAIGCRYRSISTTTTSTTRTTTASRPMAARTTSGCSAIVASTPPVAPSARSPLSADRFISTRTWFTARRPAAT